MVSRSIPKFDTGADGLRGIAAMNVLLSHYFTMFVPVLKAKNYPGVYAGDPDALAIYELLRFPLFNIFYNGQFAVIVFFVLSGYVLTLPAHAGNRDTIQRRFWGRYLRLNIPVACAVLFAWALQAGGLYYTDGRVEAPNPAWALDHYNDPVPFWMMLREAVFDAIFRGEPTLNIPLWSIGAEFVGSMLLLAFFFPRGRRKWITVGIVFAIGAAVYTNSVIYLLAIFIGAAIVKARLTRRGVLICAVLGIYFGGFQFDSVYYSFLHAEDWLPSTKNAMNLIGAVLLTLAVINGFAKPLVQSRPAQFLGHISFPLYILHYPMLLSFGLWSYGAMPHATFVTGLHFLAYAGACILLATLFERWIDQPAIGLSKRVARAVMLRLNPAPAASLAEPRV